MKYLGIYDTMDNLDDRKKILQVDDSEDEQSEVIEAESRGKRIQSLNNGPEIHQLEQAQKKLKIGELEESKNQSSSAVEQMRLAAIRRAEQHNHN